MLLAAKASANAGLGYVNPLTLAAKKGHVGIVDALLEARASANLSANNSAVLQVRTFVRMLTTPIPLAGSLAQDWLGRHRGCVRAARHWLVGEPTSV